MLKMFCDRCGAEIWNGAWVSVKISPRGDAGTAALKEVGADFPTLPCDICVSCAKQLSDFLKEEKR